MQFDFVLDDLKIIIEVDGRQHFIDITHWKSLAEKVQQNDAFKMLCALDNGYCIIRIYQPDVWSDDIDWDSTLLEAINDICNIYYLSQTPDIYDPLIHLLNDVEI